MVVVVEEAAEVMAAAVAPRWLTPEAWVRTASMPEAMGGRRQYARHDAQWWNGRRP